MTPQARPNGFTLIELAVAMTVIAILGASVLLAVRVQLTQRQISETRAALEDAREAVLAFAAATGRLPCPAVGGAPGQGGESALTPQGCSKARGLLPWEALGLTAVDGWNHRLAYQVTQGFGVPGFKTGAKIGLEAEGDIVLQNIAGASLASADAVVMAIWSVGVNGRFGTNPDGSSVAGIAGGAAEVANDPNASTTTKLISDTPVEIAGQEFDDEVIWISRYVLFNRMITAGKLP